jgi:hypothetical protein
MKQKYLSTTNPKTGKKVLMNPRTGKRKWPTLMEKKEAGQKQKALPKGDEQLFSKSEWISSDQLDNEKKVLVNPVIHTGFDRILEQHKPIQHTAFLSMCTAVRPYYKSEKWKRFIYEFHHKVDMIVSSNGGIIPENFWESWPYLNYESGPPHYASENTLYRKIGYDWMIRFFKTHSYKYVICVMNLNHRVYSVWPESLKELKEGGYIEDYKMIPDTKLYKLAKDDGFHGSNPNSGGEMFPELHKFILDAIIEQVDKFGYDKSKMPKTIFDL